MSPTPTFSFRLQTRRNLVEDQTIANTFGFIYRNPCLLLVGGIERSFIERGDVRPGTTFSLRVTLKHLGEVGGQVLDRLELQVQLLLVDGPPQVGDQLGPAHRRFPQPLRAPSVRGLAGRLRRVHGDVRVAQQVGVAGVLRPVLGDPDARRGVHARLVAEPSGAQGGQQPAGQLLGPDPAPGVERMTGAGVYYGEAMTEAIS